MSVTVSTSVSIKSSSTMFKLSEVAARELASRDYDQFKLLNRRCYFVPILKQKQHLSSSVTLLERLLLIRAPNSVNCYLALLQNTHVERAVRTITMLRLKIFPSSTSQRMTSIVKPAMSEVLTQKQKWTRAKMVPNMVSSYASTRFLSAIVIGSKITMYMSEKPFNIP